MSDQKNHLSPYSAAPVFLIASLLTACLAGCGAGAGAGNGTDLAAAAPALTTAPATTPVPDPATVPVPATAATDGPPAYLPLFADDTQVSERIQYSEADGTLVTLMGMRPTERHARERGEPWTDADVQQGRYLTFPTFYFQNRTFGLEIRDRIPAGGKTIEIRLHVNDGTFEGTTFSLFRSSLNPLALDYGWNLNTGFANPKEAGKNLCHAGLTADCTMTVDANWNTDPHSPLKLGDRIELAPAPFLPHDANFRALIDGGGPRYYSFEQLYVVGVGVQPWYGVAPRLDSAPLPTATLLGGQTTLSYNYSDEANRVFQQMANNIGIANTRQFVQGRRLFHTSFIDGKHSEHPDDNPVFSAHIGQVGPRFNQARCIACHAGNGRSPMPPPGLPLDTFGVLVAADPVYGLNVQQHASAAGGNEWPVSVLRYDSSLRTLPSGEQVELVKPVYAFKGPVPAQYSVRQAPQVIGLGLIEALAESTILALADPADKNGDGIRGIPSWVVDPENGQNRLGRFGWKARTASLRQQIGDALVKDMGVTSPVFPARSCQRGAADCRTADGSAGVTEAELKTLTNYMALVAVPAQRSLRSGYPEGVQPLPGHDIDPQQIARGSTLFAQAQCSACHTPTLTTGNTHPLAELRNQVIHPYSNFLLHDMGPGLADTLAQGNATLALWRTAPLWGIGALQYVQGGADKARYLHDGRARTLQEAILWHGGESDASRLLYEGFSVTDRAALLAFLASL